MKREAGLIFAAPLNNLERGLVRNSRLECHICNERGAFVFQLPEGASN